MPYNLLFTSFVVIIFERWLDFPGQREKAGTRFVSEYISGHNATEYQRAGTKIG